VLPTVVQTVREALRLPYTGVALRQAGGSIIAAEAGTPVADPLRLPLVYQGEPVGELLLGPRAPGEGFSPADRRLLDDLAHQAGVAVHAVHLTTDLRRARERLVSAREEERRRLRRDLHDGLGPQLAAQTLKVGSARVLLMHDQQAADRLLAELEDDIQHALADIRRLVYALRPPALDELGLVGALRASAAQYLQRNQGGVVPSSANGLRISVEAPEVLPPLPAGVEVAIYRIVQEALANVVRHAGARTCRVRVWVDGALHLMVTDDGVGLPPEPRTGVGLASMRERAEELGGTCEVERGPEGGTRVTVVLPLSRVEEAGHLGRAADAPDAAVPDGAVVGAEA
jgi:signal transduction histidine kinase